MRVDSVLAFLLLEVATHESMALSQPPGTFTATGKMISRRYFHTATLLQDGRVLIAWHAATAQVVSPGKPAFAGEYLSMYTTGLGDGNVIPPQVAVGGQLAEILYFGDAPAYAEYSQVNFRMPSGVVPGLAVPVHLGRPSNEVTIAVQ